MALVMMPPRSPPGLGDSDFDCTRGSCHFSLEGLLCGGGWRFKPKRKQMPPEGASVGSQGPVGQWPPLPALGSEQVPEPQVLHCLPSGLPG